MPTHDQCLSSVLLFATTITTFILFAVNAIQAEVTVSRTHYRNVHDEQVGQGEGDVDVEDSEASVRTDQAEAPQMKNTFSIIFYEFYYPPYARWLYRTHWSGLHAHFVIL